MGDEGASEARKIMRDAEPLRFDAPLLPRGGFPARQGLERAGAGEGVGGMRVVEHATQLRRAGQLEESENAFHRVLLDAPEHLEAWIGLAHVLTKQGRQAAA